jgi:hypothetical protein
MDSKKRVLRRAAAVGVEMEMAKFSPFLVSRARSTRGIVGRLG